MPDISAQIRENLAHVRQRMAAAAIRSGRSAEEIKLVAVTKYVGKAEIEALVAAGCTDLGESRPQQLWQRAKELADLPIRWHLIGHLQRNKVRRTLPLASMIHSADSLRIIKALDETAAELGRPGDCPDFRGHGANRRLVAKHWSAKMGLSPFRAATSPGTVPIFVSTKMGLSPLASGAYRSYWKSTPPASRPKAVFKPMNSNPCSRNWPRFATSIYAD